MSKTRRPLTPEIDESAELTEIIEHLRDRLFWADYVRDDEVEESYLRDIRKAANALCTELNLLYNHLEL